MKGCYQRERKGSSLPNEATKISERALHSLREKLARAGYPAVERNRREMRAVALFSCGPGFHAWSHSAQRAAERAHQTIVGVDSAHASTGGCVFGAEAHKLKKSFEITGRDAVAVNARRFTYAGRKLDPSAGSQDRPAVVNETFREHCNQNDVDESQNHARVAIPQELRGRLAAATTSSRRQGIPSIRPCEVTLPPLCASAHIAADRDFLAGALCGEIRFDFQRSNEQDIPLRSGSVGRLISQRAPIFARAGMQNQFEENEMPSPTAKPRPNPDKIFETLNAYQQTAALRAAIALDIFTKIGEGADTFAALAKKCEATERGIRILCDYLVVQGFLTKHGGRYALTDDSATFLDRRSPACIASAAGFLTLPVTINAYHDLARTIRTGQPGMAEGEGSISEENPIWVEFARSMAPMVTPSAEEIARILDAPAGKKWKVLDLAGGHGMFGITLAKRNPNAEIFAQDWGPVLTVATENARAAGVDARHHLIPGSAFDVEYGTGYDIVLVTNFLHHFDAATNEKLLRKVRASLAPGGIVATLDFVPNEDRVSPPRAASFNMMMLGMTPAGDSYPFSEYERMFRNAGFSSNELRPLQTGGHSLILSRI